MTRLQNIACVEGIIVHATATPSLATPGTAGKGRKPLAGLSGLAKVFVNLGEQLRNQVWLERENFFRNTTYIASMPWASCTSTSLAKPVVRDDDPGRGPRSTHPTRLCNIEYRFSLFMGSTNGSKVKETVTKSRGIAFVEPMQYRNHVRYTILLYDS